MGVLSRWRALDAADRHELLPAAWRVLVVRVSLGLLGVARTQRVLGRFAPAGQTVLDAPALWHRRALAVRRVAARVPDARCLVRSVVLWWWMRASGLDPQVCMGVRPGQGGMEGHAWVECDGHVIDETPDAAASFRSLGWRSPG